MLKTEIKYVVRCTECGYERNISFDQYKRIEMMDRKCPACSDEPKKWSQHEQSN